LVEPRNTRPCTLIEPVSQIRGKACKSAGCRAVRGAPAAGPPGEQFVGGHDGLLTPKLLGGVTQHRHEQELGEVRHGNFYRPNACAVGTGSRCWGIAATRPSLPQSHVTPTSWPLALPGRRAVPAGIHRTGCSLVLQRLQRVESRRSPGGEDGGPDPGHHREQDEPRRTPAALDGMGCQCSPAAWVVSAARGTPTTTLARGTVGGGWLPRGP
jgi:hypothetical protein